MDKKRSYWVLFAVRVLVGASLLVFLGSHNQLPVVPDVSAQVNNMDSYVSPGIYIQDYIGSYRGSYSPGSTFNTCAIDCGRTSDTCHIDCGWTSITCFKCTSLNCPDIKYRRATELTCDCDSPDFWQGPQTTSTCPPICGGGNTMLYCPTSTTCGIICGGGNTILFCPTSTTCIPSCFGVGSQNPPSLPEGVGSWYQPGGITIPGSIVPYPVWSSTPTVPFGLEYSQYQFPGTVYQGFSDYTQTTAW